MAAWSGPKTAISSISVVRSLMRCTSAAADVLAQRAVEDGAALVRTLTGTDWRGRAATEAAEALVDAFLTYW